MENSPKQYGTIMPIAKRSVAVITKHTRQTTPDLKSSCRGCHYFLMSSLTVNVLRIIKNKSAFFLSCRPNFLLIMVDSFPVKQAPIFHINKMRTIAISIASTHILNVYLKLYSMRSETSRIAVRIAILPPAFI